VSDEPMKEKIVEIKKKAITPAITL